MKDIINILHGRADTVVIADIPDVEFQLRALQMDAHVFLLLLVAAEDPDLLDFRVQEPLQDRVPERTGTACNQQGIVFKHWLLHPAWSVVVSKRIVGADEFVLFGWRGIIYQHSLVYPLEDEEAAGGGADRATFFYQLTDVVQRSRPT